MPVFIFIIILIWLAVFGSLEMHGIASSGAFILIFFMLLSLVIFGGSSPANDDGGKDIGED